MKELVLVIKFCHKTTDDAYRVALNVKFKNAKNVRSSPFSIDPFSLLTRQRRTPRRRWTKTVTTVSGAAANWEVALGSAVVTVSSGESNQDGAALGGFDGVQRRQQAGKRAAGSAASISRVSIM
ncbi:hypothetical protein Droror1_Dr00014897 [Drosera rotundifolia]